MEEQDCKRLAARMWKADEEDLSSNPESTEGFPMWLDESSTKEGNPTCAVEDVTDEGAHVGDASCSIKDVAIVAPVAYSTKEGVIDMESVRSFEQLSGWEAVLGHMEQELKSGWEVKDEVYRDTMYTGAKSIACAVSDPNAPDCPLVYISSGFESLTQYTRTYALGRNCRFLQPQPLKKNLEYNGDEIRRMKQFCVEQKTGQIVTLLYNEAKDGSHFWNLLFMNHIKCKGLTHSNARHYIFAVQTNIVVQKELIDNFILINWLDGGKENLSNLRERFKAEEYTYSPKETSLKKLADNIVSEWICDVGRSESSFWEGSNFVPVVGKPAVQEFWGVWPSLVEQAVHGIKALFDVSDKTAENLKTNSDPAVVCAVADPAYFDCPLVFLSVGFEDMTGYRNDFALGRNCRFLQPNVGDLNRKINGDELGRMKIFCQKQGPPGSKILNLLLNERRNGERFWNLLHMEHVSVEGKPYILGVQTVLDMPMPSILKDRETSQAMLECDTAMLTTFVDELAIFLQQFRFSLRAQHMESVVEASKYAHGSIISFMKRNCDDFEGDHIVPRMGKKEVQEFEIDITWKVMLSRVQTLLVEVWDISEYNDEEVACAVSDPNGNDCPLVYVSQKFERMTGYPREWVVGRNCRFLQPNDSKRNMDFNEEDKARMRDFCSKPQPEGTRLMNLLINEDRSGYPFWNVLVMEHVEVTEKGTRKDYIFAVQTKIDIEAMRLAEILTLDRDGKRELTRLRELLRTMETDMQKCSIKNMADALVRQWVSDFPPHLEMPRFQLASSRPDHCVPLFGVFLSPEQPLLETIQANMEEGVRHFALTLNDNELVEDATHVEQVGRLFSFRLAELFHTMRLKHLHYLREAMAFSLITRPQYVSSFKAVSKALNASGYRLQCWLLDVRSISPDRPMSKAGEAKVQQCWTTMVAARKAGDVNAIGLYGPIGSIMPAMESLKKVCNLHSVAVLAVDDYPGKEQDLSRFEKFRKLYIDEYGSPSLFTYNLFGPNDSLLKCPNLQHCTAQWGMNVATALLKWAESQHYGAFVSTVRDDGLQFNMQDLPDFHRSFTRGYTGAPSAHFCAVGLKDFFDQNANQKKVDMIANTQCSQIRTEMTLPNSTAPTIRRNSFGQGLRRRSVTVGGQVGLPNINEERHKSCVEQVAVDNSDLKLKHAAIHLKRASTGSVRFPRRQESLEGGVRPSLLEHSNKEQLLAAREQLLADFKNGDIGRKRPSRGQFASHSPDSRADGNNRGDGIKTAHRQYRRKRNHSDDSLGGLSNSDSDQGKPQAFPESQPSGSMNFKAWVDEQRQSKQNSRRSSKASVDENQTGSKRKSSNLVVSDRFSSEPVASFESGIGAGSYEILQNGAGSKPSTSGNLGSSTDLGSVCGLSPRRSGRAITEMPRSFSASEDFDLQEKLRKAEADLAHYRAENSALHTSLDLLKKAADKASAEMPSEASKEQNNAEQLAPVRPPGKKPESRRPSPSSNEQNNAEQLAPVRPPGKKPESRRPSPSSHDQNNAEQLAPVCPPGKKPESRRPSPLSREEHNAEQLAPVCPPGKKPESRRPSPLSREENNAEQLAPVCLPDQKPESSRGFPTGSRTAARNLQSDGAGPRRPSRQSDCEGSRRPSRQSDGEGSRRPSRQSDGEGSRRASKQSDGEGSRRASKYLSHGKPSSSQIEETLLGA